MNPREKRSSYAPRFSVLSEAQIDDLHQAALEILRQTGVRVYHQEALELAVRAGASVSEGNLVEFPERLVQEAIASAPSSIEVLDRDGEPAMSLEAGKSYFGPGSDCLRLLEGETGQTRPFTSADLKDGYRLCDALPNMHFLMSLGIPSDVDSTVSYDVQMALMLENTTKPIVFVVNDGAGCRRAVDMAAAAVGGSEALLEKQYVILYTEPSSPLKQSETAMDKLLLMADLGLPVIHSTSPMMGATAPITLAGGLAQSLAEVLSGLVLHQLRSPGAPIIIGAGLRHMDMGSMQISYGSPEFQLTRGAIEEMARWYGLPTFGFAGCSDAKVLDQQAAAEGAMSVIMAALSGTNLVHDAGYMESGLSTSYEMIVLTDELVSMAGQITGGVEVSKETLLLDEVHRVGPDGHYVEAESTLERFRHFWYPGLFDRRRRHQWEEAGAVTLGQRLTERVKVIVVGHRGRRMKKDRVEMIRELLVTAGDDAV